MYAKLIRNNITGDKTVTLTTMFFITAAAMFLSLSAMLGGSLYGAVGRLMEEAETPHFMQMHSGALDMGQLEEFARDHGNVSDFQVLGFLGVDGSQIILGRNSLSGSMQDNGFSTQSSRFDFLLDLDNRPVHPGPGELYVPVCYYRDRTAAVGDEATVNGVPFTVAGFVRDSQMNSALASSKRFVVSQEDYRRLESVGTTEYLIEFRLKDMAGLGAFEAAYSAAGLPANGPAVTWPLFRMLSAVSDGIMAAVIMMTGVLVVLIALLCVRFTLLAKMEDDYREIGVMKGIGMRCSDIRMIYRSVYAVMAGAGSLAGFILAALLQMPLRESIRLNLGDSGNRLPALLAGMAGAAAVFLTVLIYVNYSLQCVRRLSAAQAIRFAGEAGAMAETGSGSGSKWLRLSQNRLLPTNLFLAVKDVSERRKLYITMLMVSALASFIMIVPQNLYHTISGSEFITYLGVGNCDIRLDIRPSGETYEDAAGKDRTAGTDIAADHKTAAVVSYIADSPDITNYAVFTTKMFQARMENGATENIKVELGDHTVFPLRYVEGRMPVAENEIALSVMNAEDLEKGVGEEIRLRMGDVEKRLTVCGIYSDITNGGKTAKAVFEDHTTGVMWTVVCAKLADTGRISGVIDEMAEHFPFAKVSGTDAYMAQTFGQTVEAVHTASVAAVLAAAAVVLAVTLLFMKMLVAKDRYSIAVMRAVGFQSSDIRCQYAWRAVLVMVLGITVGTILAGTVGESLSGAAIASIGAGTFQFQVNPLATYVVSPLVLLASTLLATVWGTRRAGDLSVYESLKE